MGENMTMNTKGVVNFLETYAGETEPRKNSSRQGMCAVSPLGDHFRPPFCWQCRASHKGAQCFLTGHGLTAAVCLL